MGSSCVAASPQHHRPLHAPSAGEGDARPGRRRNGGEPRPVVISSAAVAEKCGPHRSGRRTGRGRLPAGRAAGEPGRHGRGRRVVPALHGGPVLADGNRAASTTGRGQAGSSVSLSGRLPGNRVLRWDRRALFRCFRALACGGSARARKGGGGAAGREAGGRLAGGGGRPRVAASRDCAAGAPRGAVVPPRRLVPSPRSPDSPSGGRRLSAGAPPRLAHCDGRAAGDHGPHAMAAAWHDQSGGCRFPHPAMCPKRNDDHRCGYCQRARRCLRSVRS